MIDNTITPRSAANMILRSLMQHLRRVQESILLVERFGALAVTWPDIQTRLRNTDDIEALRAEHANTVARITSLSAMMDKASEEEILAFVQSRRNDR